MLILTIRTDNPEAEIGLFDNHTKLAYETWLAHRELSNTIHRKITSLFLSQVFQGRTSKNTKDVKAIVVFQGPGSFTGLRIGLSTANALAYGLGIPVVGTMGDDWIDTGITQLQAGKNDRIVLPRYGAPVHITTPKR